MRRWEIVCLFGLFAPGHLHAQGFPPEDAVRRIQTPAGLRATLVAAEPLVRQPVAIDFDDRGRLWVIQYLQYPNPAGLKRAKVDRYSRTTYDRIPEPPPKGPKGADRITILQNPDASGRFRGSVDFVKDLNLTTGFAFGHGGVFVLQVPYLLFYPDKDGDGVPDADPEVLLQGFGMEDAHSVANSLTWGPDGWLYGCQGSTVTANIRGIVFQQGVWRYHPITRAFELFCDGGGNSWGLDFDRHGNLFYSTNHGGFVMLHGVQGGYYWKAFEKHGAFQNPFTFGWFDHVHHQDFRGGHVSVGGLFYRGNAFPPQYRDQYIAGDLLGHGVHMHSLERFGSTFKSRTISTLVTGNDTWFAPCDVTLGPDGAIYVADWYDQRTAHPDPDAEWDRTNGRIYRFEATASKPMPVPDWRKRSSMELVGLLSNSNDWIVRRARRILAERRDPEVILPLRRIALESADPQVALESLWALYVSGGFSDAFALQTLSHANPHLRRWAVRFVGDEGRVSASVANRLEALAKSEPDVTVRSQLASSARRLPASAALPVLHGLLQHSGDAKDPHLPLLLWWAVEKHAIKDSDAVLHWFGSDALWKNPLVAETIAPRLMRRWAAERQDRSFDACAKLLRLAPPLSMQRSLALALEQGLRDQPGIPSNQAMGTLFTQFADSKLPRRKINDKLKLPETLKETLVQTLAHTTKTDLAALRILVAIGFRPAREELVASVANRETPAERLVELLAIVREMDNDAELGNVVLKRWHRTGPEKLQLAVLAAAENLDHAGIETFFLNELPHVSPAVRAKVLESMVGRKTSARMLLHAVEGGKISAKEIPAETMRGIRHFEDAELDRLVTKHWGFLQGGTPEEKLAEMRRFNNDLNAGAGDLQAGHQLFQKHCAICHQLFGEGEKIGPDLTFANRKDRAFLLASLVDPSAMIRKEFLSYTVHLQDGRLMSGMILEQNANQIVLANAKAEKTVIARDRIERVEESPISLMPENLLKTLTPHQLRDLFRYLQK